MNFMKYREVTAMLRGIHNLIAAHGEVFTGLGGPASGGLLPSLCKQ